MPQDSKPTTKLQTFFSRSVSTIGLWLVVGFCFASMNPYAHIALISALATLALGEYFSLLKKSEQKSDAVWAFFCACSFVLMHYFFLKGKCVPTWFDGAFIFLLVAGAMILQLRKPIDPHGTLISIMHTILGPIWLVWMFSFAGRIDFLTSGEGVLPGAMILLWCIAVTKFTDMGAYITGSVIGKHKMIPHISPGKTWEGFVGALFFALLASWSMQHFFPKQVAALGTPMQMHGFAIVIALISVVGDLVESMWKRAVQVKDSGSFLPGIGGAMDLIDSLCITLPATWFYLQIIHS